MDILFREFSDIMDDSNDKIPEGIYLALYNKLKELKDTDDRQISQINLNVQKTIEQINAAETKKKELEHRIKERDDRIMELEEDAMRSRPRCKCGSTTHLKTNSLSCRLNKRVLDGVLGTVARDRALAETAAVLRDTHWRNALTVGTVIDAQDSDKRWFDAVITTVDGDLLGVHYRGWDAKWDRKNVLRSSETIQPLYTHTIRWREFTQGDLVEVRVGPRPNAPTGLWYWGNVTQVSHAQRRIMVTIVGLFGGYRPPMWIDFDSEDVCRPGTHKKY